MRRESTIEINYFYQHYRDAQTFLRFAKEERSKLKSFFARHSILSTIFASEALINKVYDEFYLGADDSKDTSIIEKLSTPEKWKLAPLVCGKTNPPGKTFERGKEPFQSFKELIKIRNDFVHAKSGVYVNAEEDGTFSWGDGPEVPYFRILPGVDYYPQTKIPKNPFETNEIHAEKALSTLKYMISKLLKFFENVFDEHWLWKCAYRTEGEENKQKLHIDWIWGGLTPSEEST